MGRVKLHHTPRRTPERRLEDRDNRSGYAYLRKVSLEAAREQREKLMAEYEAEVSETEPSSPVK